MSNIYALLSKHQIQHGLENDEARIGAFISDLEKEVEKIIGPNIYDPPHFDTRDINTIVTVDLKYSNQNELRDEQRDTKTKFFTKG